MGRHAVPWFPPACVDFSGLLELARRTSETADEVQSQAGEVDAFILSALTCPRSSGQERDKLENLLNRLGTFDTDKFFIQAVVEIGEVIRIEAELM